MYLDAAKHVKRQQPLGFGGGFDGYGHSLLHYSRLQGLLTLARTCDCGDSTLPYALRAQSAKGEDTGGISRTEGLKNQEWRIRL
jgi:hypothetical protein